MSMLAEPRRKQKWSVDPRNSTWTNDDSKFGQKMLERMGWSKGKGLGRTEQGSTDHIKVKVKNDNFGLGTNASHEDNWIAHQDDFNELLAQLNNCHGQNNSEIPKQEEQKNFSLEEKSKTSKNRVHYMKFTKGKDLSSRTETDLNCIFGKRARPTKHQEQKPSISDSQGETEEITAPLELDTETITNTVTSSLTMQQYFAQRMARMKKACGAQSQTSTVEISSLLEDPSPTQCTENAKVSKKKKKNKKTADEMEVIEENDAATTTEDREKQEPSKKKKKKRKNAEVKETAIEDSTPPTLIEPNSEEMPSSKKKKRKRIQKHCDESQPLIEHEPKESDGITSEMPQKRKKSGHETNDVQHLDGDTPVQKKSKKKKKSQK